MTFGGVEGFADPSNISPDLEHWFAQIRAEIQKAATATIGTGGDGITISGGNVISVDYAAGASNLIGAPSLLVGNAATTDRILVTEGGASAVVRQAEVSQFPFTDNDGTVTEVTVGTGLDVTNGTTTPNITVDLDEIGVGGTLIAGDHLVAVNGTATQKQLISAIPLGIFSNDQGWTSNSGTVTQVDGTGTVSGLTLTGSVTASGSLTLGGTLSVLEGDIVDGSILARVASDETITGSYTFTDVDGIFVNVGPGGLYLQNSAFHAASLMTAGLKYVPGGGTDNSPYDRLNWEYTDTAGGSNNAGSAVIMRGNNMETGLTVEWYTAPTSTGIGANPASWTKRFGMTSGALEYGTSAQFRVTSAGLITAGEWDATTIAVAHGGTGISGGIAAQQFLIGNGTGNPYVASGANLVWSGTQLLLANGTVADPIIGFINDEDTGMWFNGTGIGFTYAGVNRATIDSAGISVVADVISNTSDRRLKHNIVPLTGALDHILNWEAMRYEYTFEARCRGVPEGVRVGLFAQDIQEEYPEAIYPAPHDDDYLTYDNKQVVPVLVAAIQELTARVAELEARLG